MKVETLPAFYNLVFCSYLLQSYEYLTGHGMMFPENNINLFFLLKSVRGAGGEAFSHMLRKRR